MDIIVIERDNDNVWKNLNNEERLPLLNYRGFDSIKRWPFYQELFKKKSLDFTLINDLVPLHELEKIKLYYKLVNGMTSNKIDILLIGDLNSKMPNETKSIFLGFDIGIIIQENEPIFFSVVLNEIRLTGNRFLRDFVEKLNDNYLFSESNDCIEFLKSRKEAFASNYLSYIETAYDTDDLKIFSIFEIAL